MNFPNLLTLSRIPLMLLVIGFLYPDPTTMWPGMRSLALVLFLFAALTDWLDGWLARKFGQVSEFGKFMDALADKVLTMGMFVSLLALGALEKWTLFLILLILSREFLITGLRLVAAAKGKTLAAEKIGKIKTVVQLICISLFLGQLAMEVDGYRFLDITTNLQVIETLRWAGQLSLIFATLLTVFSGIIYLVKYWKYFLDE
ncbi:MAG: CDP-diacylglycerol--glycerol-3-phosphate 3-phosphatidyltransferase [Verrucomicrobiota bacterium]|nr:CDP-diacylglycerol--glycerol-3-phosphate 3-phosphatidyltransferase [Verrucomicrobiota bacterium]